MRGLLTTLTLSAALAFLANSALADTISLDESTHSIVQVPSDIVLGVLGLCEGPVGSSGHCQNPSGISPLSDAVNFLVPFSNLRSDPPDTPGTHDDPVDGFIGPDCLTGLPCKLVAETADANGQETIVYTPNAGEPGFSPSIPLTYVITSDGSGTDLAPVPEPSTLALAVPGMIPFALVYLKRRKPLRDRGQV
jgi:hypothetical protein